MAASPHPCTALNCKEKLPRPCERGSVTPVPAAVAPVTTALLLAALVAAGGEVPDSYRDLGDHGIVSGFGIDWGDPSAMINRIPAIDLPHYIPVAEAETSFALNREDLCVGIDRDGVMHFAPLFILNSHEIVNHADAPAIAYCPLAGLSVAIDGKTYISGLLRWDTFVLYDPEDESLILPFDQRSLDGKRHVPLHPLRLLTFAGVVAKFPDAQILSPELHRGDHGAYGSYATDGNLGIGHPKPGMRGEYDADEDPIHPKENVLIVGTANELKKAYPFSQLAAATANGAHSFTDTIDGIQIALSYDPKYKCADVETVDTGMPSGPAAQNMPAAQNKPAMELRPRAFSYYFAMRQHLPDLPVYVHK